MYYYMVDCLPGVASSEKVGRYVTIFIYDYNSKLQRKCASQGSQCDTSVLTLFFNSHLLDKLRWCLSVSTGNALEHSPCILVIVQCYGQVRI